MKKVIICEDVLNPQSYETHEVENVCDFLMQRFPKWPDNARIYRETVSAATDVTPHDEASADALNDIEGPFWIVVYPEGIETILIVVAITVAAVAIGVAFLMRPHLKDAPNQHAGSPNNSLSDRTNRARPNERIPDIYGTLRSTPDLLAQPYRVFEKNVEVEHCYMCIGRGSFDILDVRDDVTPLADIEGCSVEVYGPNTSPNSGDNPQLRIGAAINRPIVGIKSSNCVNGQVLDAPNKNVHSGPRWPGGPDQTYTATWFGPFVMGDETTAEVWCNFVAENGLYKIGSDGVQVAMDVTIEVGITPIDFNRNPIGAEQLYRVHVLGSNVEKSMVGSTMKAVLAAPGPVSVRARRITNTVLTSGVSVCDDVQWRDSYAVSHIDQTHFGNVTTVQSLTLPTKQALSVKERKLNLLVTRKLPVYIPPADGNPAAFGALAPTNNAADIFCAAALDPYIGNRVLDELDTEAIYDAVADVESYFGTELATEFCYTFDDAGMSFEEIANDIANAVFCTAMRRGCILSIEFEKLTHNSTLLFNHRNKIPGSETRTITFGTQSGNDGIELEYIDPYAPNYPDVDSSVTLYYPANKSARNARKIKAVGIRNNVQAWLFGWRLYQKLFYQNTTIQFSATQEAMYCARHNRILVADNTRTGTQDGEVVEQNGLVLTLSQPITFVPGTTYNIFLQLYDGTIQSIAITAGPAANKVVLAGPPTLPLVTDAARYARTTYMIQGSTATRQDAFLLEESSSQGNQTFELKAINYDDRYYDHDEDFINGIIEYNKPDGILSGGTGGSTPGSRFNASTYSDLSQLGGGVNDPIYAIDADFNSSATVYGWYDSTIIPTSPDDEIDLGLPIETEHTYNRGTGELIVGFASAQIGLASKLHVKASYNGAGQIPCSIVATVNGVQHVLVASTTGSAGITDYTVDLDANVDLSTVSVKCIASGATAVVTATGMIYLYAVYVEIPV